jgi:hypothetical protein
MLRFAIAANVFVVLMASEPAAAATCSQLWYARNSLYKETGYCFRTARGIQAFGNAGCQYDDVADVPLSARQRAAVAEIQREERYQGCTP